MPALAVPGYWRTAAKRAWDTFSLHQGVGGIALPGFIVFIGYLLGAAENTIGKWTGLAGGFAVALIWYMIVLLVITPPQLWRESQAKLQPALEVVYDGDNSLFRPSTHETYRLRLTNTGVQSLSGVKARITSVPTAPYLRGIVPISLRAQHGENPPFTLNDNAPLWLDCFEVGPELFADFRTPLGPYLRRDLQ